MASVLRRWPLVVLLVALALFFDVEAMVRLRTAGSGWVLPGVVVMTGLALLAEARPVVSALGAVVTLVVSSVMLWAVGAEMLAGLTVIEAAALAAIIVAVVRGLRPMVAAGLVGLLLAVGVAAAELRPQYWSLPEGSLPDPWWSVSLTALAAATLPVAYGLHLRGRDRRQAHTSRAEVIAVQQRVRLELARELHEVVAHEVGEMLEQVRSAQAQALTDPGAAERVLPSIEHSGRNALSSMRRMVAALRDADENGNRTTATARTADLSLHPSER